MFRLFVLVAISSMFDGVWAYYEYSNENDETASTGALISWLTIVLWCSFIASSIVSTVLMGIGGGSIVAVLTTKKRQSQGPGKGQVFIPANAETMPTRTGAGEDDLETANSCFEFTV
ncbi:hypothetical protein M3Y94_00686300 [Aphelenchoides besseyi]|nr:hypothetical protein M3Y94_00686300 [Aphelenchoides besseyi]KAI6231478.1 hypothetical protein M3Y95_00386000 [Aphelenchoides besseyi]